jgi:hypothetical protein
MSARQFEAAEPEWMDRPDATPADLENALLPPAPEPEPPPPAGYSDKKILETITISWLPKSLPHRKAKERPSRKRTIPTGWLRQTRPLLTTAGNGGAVWKYPQSP